MSPEHIHQPFVVSPYARRSFIAYMKNYVPLPVTEQETILRAFTVQTLK